jgi:DNA repair protein RecO (recombination protein O)
MKSFKTEGIVIKRRNVGEADRIITVFTKHHGKIQIKATGVRKINSRRSSYIELLNYSEMHLYKGRSLPLLTEVENINNFSEIKKDLGKVGFSYHLCELIDGLCAENQENEPVFNLLLKTLQSMSNTDDLPMIIHGFEIELLTLLGFYKPSNVSRDLDTETFIEQILERKLKTKRLLPRFT